MKYIMELTEEQYNHIAKCVEVCHRVACGQIDSLNEILPNRIEGILLDAIKSQAFPELSLQESYCWDGGYRNDKHGENFRKAFDIFQTQGYQIYRQMCYIRNKAKGIDNVLSSPTLTTDKAQQPRIIVIADEYMDEDNEKTCGKCLFWSQWTGACINHQSKHLYDEMDYDAEPCEKFEWEESYKPDEKWKNNQNQEQKKPESENENTTENIVKR